MGYVETFFCVLFGNICFFFVLDLIPTHAF